MDAVVTGDLLRKNRKLREHGESIFLYRSEESINLTPVSSIS